VDVGSIPTASTSALFSSVFRLADQLTGKLVPFIGRMLDRMPGDVVISWEDERCIVCLERGDLSVANRLGSANT
jgi:hypothetical protein